MEQDRQACYDVISRVNEETSMPAKLLLVTVGLRDNEQIAGSRGAVSENVRWSSFFIQLFQDDWGPRDLFRKLFFLAVECRGDDAMPMRNLAVCLKDAPHETHAEILAFRRELEEQQNLRILRYSTLDELKTQLTAVCREWAQATIDAGINPETA